MVANRKLVVWVLIAWTAALPVMAGNPAALVTGTANLNGEPIAAATALATGDAITTGPAGNATVAIGAAEARAGAATSFRLEGSAAHLVLRLEQGNLHVEGELPLTLDAYSITAMPAADYNVTWNGAAATISVATGTVSIKGGGRKETVNAGRTAILDTPAETKPSAGGGHAWAIIFVAAAITVAAGLWVHEATACKGCVVN